MNNTSLNNVLPAPQLLAEEASVDLQKGLCANLFEPMKGILAAGKIRNREVTVADKEFGELIKRGQLPFNKAVRGVEGFDKVIWLEVYRPDYVSGASITLDKKGRAAREILADFLEENFSSEQSVPAYKPTSWQQELIRKIREGRLPTWEDLFRFFSIARLELRAGIADLKR